MPPLNVGCELIVRKFSGRDPDGPECPFGITYTRWRLAFDRAPLGGDTIPDKALRLPGSLCSQHALKFSRGRRESGIWRIFSLRASERGIGLGMIYAKVIRADGASASRGGVKTGGGNYLSMTIAGRLGARRAVTYVRKSPITAINRTQSRLSLVI